MIEDSFSVDRKRDGWKSLASLCVASEKNEAIGKRTRVAHLSGVVGWSSGFYVPAFLKIIGDRGY